MNERIKELKEQATVCTPHGHDGVKWIFNPELFAELIVRECISTIENLSPGYQDYRNQIEDAFRRDCVEQIKQHFGVE
jgi:hypothetical protein